MLEFSISSVLQVLVALGLLNVWLVRSGKATSYRGGGSQTLKQEFSSYGLPEAAFYVVGTLKILSAVLLIAGIWFPKLVLPVASVVVVLMVGALAMHLKVKDPAIKSLPALLVLLMSVGLCALALP